jgi:hypothetical protein
LISEKAATGAVSLDPLNSRELMEAKPITPTARRTPRISTLERRFT